MPNPGLPYGLTQSTRAALVLILGVQSGAMAQTARPKSPAETRPPAAAAPAPAPALPVQPQAPAQGQPQAYQNAPNIPSPEALLALVRTHILALDHAIRANNFTVLHAISGPILQQKLNPQQLADAFASLRAQRVDLVAAAFATPVLTEQPGISQNGLLRLAGGFPTRPMELRFEMVFQVAGGEWRLAGMNVAGVPTPAAPAPAQAQRPSAPGPLPAASNAGAAQTAPGVKR
jgi:hypothetical protein